MAEQKMKPEDIIKRYEISLKKKDEFRSLYEDAYEFALPQRNLYDGFYDGNVGGQKKMNRVFDATAINSTQRFANRMQSGIFPPQTKWCKLEPGPDIPAERKAEAQMALDVYTEKMFATVKQSNIDIAIGEFLLDLAVGTAAMMVQPGDDISPINFIPVPQFLVSFEEGANGQVDNVYRRMRIKGEAIQRQWPDASIPDALKSKIDLKPSEDVELLEATILDVKRGDYTYHVIHKETKSEVAFRRMKTSLVAKEVERNSNQPYFASTSSGSSAFTIVGSPNPVMLIVTALLWLLSFSNIEIGKVLSMHIFNAAI